MNTSVRQVSSLEKVRSFEVCSVPEIFTKTLMRGENYSYQIVVHADGKTDVSVEISSPIREYIKLYSVKNSIIDFATYDWADDDYITREPGMMPDLLMPLENENGILRIANESVSLWIKVCLPREMEPGEYPIDIRLFSDETGLDETRRMTLWVTDKVLPERELIFTQWFHVDCIADVHRVPVYSEEHWNLVEKYMSLAAELGINMILTPIITPPLDTKVGTTRPCTQLVRIEKHGEKYTFDWTLLKRWIGVCKKCKIKYYEMSHLFSQWGIKYAANVKVLENGVESYKFGWHTEAKSPEYRDFLMQFLPALVEVLREEGIADNTYFHISDEPSADHLDAYEYAYNLIKPLIGGCPTLDAISDYKFYERGLIPTPVTSIAHIHEFVEHDVEDQWAYYCCGEAHLVSNRFLSMPSYRNRIIGILMYKYGVKGFLQWGYNFYYSQLSVKKIDPYYTTSGDKAFPSGDPFSVYPVENGVVPSLRALVFREALNDISVCRALEEIIGRDAVIKMIDDEAGMNINFKEYPRNSEYILTLISKMQDIIKE